MKKGSKGGEKVSKKSAAEFFSEHQQIAGFDNPGKSLFTTIREFVENSLDAAESIHILPEIDVSIIEYTENEHNAKNGIDRGGHDGRKSSGNNKSNSTVAEYVDDDGEYDGEDTSNGLSNSNNNQKKATVKKITASSKSNKNDKETMYYTIKCKDNGCGIPAENIADMLGRVLSGSKHGVRQTRGKFGLGAKMALIWSKKSSGLPITIRTAYCSLANGTPSNITIIVLDIDIYKNEPRIISKRTENNYDHWRGVEISVTISGNWSNYRSRVLQYFQQLAVITPYANLSVDYACVRDEKKSFTAKFDLRSQQMPPIATEILPHPKSLNNITLGNLLSETKCHSINKFLTNELSGISATLATKIVNNLNISDVQPNSVASSKIAALCQVLRDEDNVRQPLSTCLSPAGEYNMRLGILKELQPKLVATFTDRPDSHDGHPFLVEAAVSIGGTQLREGINVYRFANRIPLLFETGADVVTQVATKRVNWTSYHIDPKKDNVGVFVSIVSTKIPFKGTSKEYVGDDVLEIQQSVRRTLIGCCQQLRVSLAKLHAKRDEQERKKTLMKYIPDISNAIMVVMGRMKSNESNRQLAGASSSSSDSNADTSSSILRRKRLQVLKDVTEGKVSGETIAMRLTQAVDHFELDTMLQASSAALGGDNAKRRKLYLTPQPTIKKEAFAPHSSSSSGNWLTLDSTLKAMICVPR